MTNFALLFNSSFEGEEKVCEVQKIPEELKQQPEGLYRFPYFLETSDLQEYKSFVKDFKGQHFGPLCLVFAVRRARDLLLEGCEYSGLQLEVETGGRRLPQLPSAAELERIVSADDCLVYVNGNPYKPVTEVFGFQQVYDDSVRCVDSLKKLGIPQETMAIYATPEEICVEIHPGVTGLDGREDLYELYYRLLCQVCEIRDVDGKPVKTNVKTIVLSSCSPDSKILVPGSTHPELHRTKVGVGPSHFAYGVAAFSDFCAKKRTVQECVQESLNWLKFVQTPLPPVAGLKEKLEAMPAVPFPGRGATAGSGGKAAVKSFSGRFQPLNAELVGAAECYQELMPAVKSSSAGLDKCLGGGFIRNSVNLLVGPVGSGKASFLLEQALQTSKQAAILYMSFDHGLREFAQRSALAGGIVSLSDLLGQLPSTEASGVEARKYMAGMIERFRGSLPDNFFFSGIENLRSELDVDETTELARMLPDEENKIVIIESLSAALLKEPQKLTALKQIAVSEKLTFLISLHEQVECGKRPHFIEGADQELLERFQRHTDSIAVCSSEKINLRKFVAMVKGQIDAQLVGKLEQKALQLAGNKRLKTDSYSLMRVIHSRYGRRELLLYLYQPDFVRFFEIASIPLGRP